MQQINIVIFFQTNKITNETLKTIRYNRIIKNITAIINKVVDCIKVIDVKWEIKVSVE